MVPGVSFGQKFGYVNTDFVLNKMPEYQKAQGDVQDLAKKWEEQVMTMQKNIDEMYSSYRAEEVLLTEEMRQDRLENNQNQGGYIKRVSEQSIWI